MTSTVLSPRESTRLENCEAVIERGLQTFIEVGNALLEIRDSRLYRRQFDTFEDYCRERWEMTHRRANQLIGAAEVIHNLGTVVPVQPTSERQVRPLISLEPEEQREAWNEAVKDSPNGKPTAKDVEAAVDRLKAPAKSDYPPRAQKPSPCTYDFMALIESVISFEPSVREVSLKALTAYALSGVNPEERPNFLMDVSKDYLPVFEKARAIRGKEV